MFHLFDKVYLSFDHNLSAYESRIVISQELASDLGTVPSPAPQHAWSPDVTGLIGSGKNYASELDFFKGIKTLADGDKLTVYCDKAAFLHLFIAWHKTLLNVTNSDNLWNIWKQFVDKESYRSTVTQKDDYVFFDDIAVGTWDRTVFDNKFSEITVSKDVSWNASILESLGIEYLLSTHLINSSTAVTTALKNKITLLAKRVLKGEIYDTKINLVSNAFNKSLHDALSIPKPDTINGLFANPSLAIFNNNSIWQENAKMVTSDSGDALDIDALAGENLSAMITAFRLIRQNFQKCAADSPFIEKIEWLNWINVGLSDSQLTGLLNSSNFSATELVDDSDTDKINMLFVDWILSLYRTNSLNTTSDLTVSV
jgi:hypothetical protein